jgi:NAD+ kinase
MLLNLGGDGTFLESLVFSKERSIPVAGINFGRLGFFFFFVSESNDSCLERLISGDYSVEKRTVIEVSSPVLPESFFPYALNECALHRETQGVISIRVHLQTGALPAYWADGLIVATPTGSTAYSLSVGGPIVFPGANVLTVAPIAPHNLNMRPLVISDGEELSVCAQGRADRVLLTLDNRTVSIPCGSEVTIRKAPFALHYVSLHTNHFITALHEKLLWGFDKRNI